MIGKPPDMNRTPLPAVAVIGLGIRNERIAELRGDSDHALDMRSGRFIMSEICLYFRRGRIVN